MPQTVQVSHVAQALPAPVYPMPLGGPVVEAPSRSYMGTGALLLCAVAVPVAILRVSGRQAERKQAERMDIAKVGLAAVVALAGAQAAHAGVPHEVVDPSNLEHGIATTQQLAADLSVPMPGFTKEKAGVMIASNIWACFHMEIDGKSLLEKPGNKNMTIRERHDDMVATHGLVWMLSGTALGHVVGAGTILGLGL